MSQNIVVVESNYHNMVNETRNTLKAIYLAKKNGIQHNPKDYAELYLKHLEALRLSGKPEIANNVVKIGLASEEYPMNVFQVFGELSTNLARQCQKEIFISDCHSMLYAGYTNIAVYMLETFLEKRLGSLKASEVPFDVLGSLNISEIRAISLLGIASVIAKDLVTANKMDSLNFKLFNEYSPACITEEVLDRNSFLLDMLYLRMMIAQEFEHPHEMKAAFELLGPLIKTGNLTSTDEQNGLYFYLKSLVSSTVDEQADNLRISLEAYECSEIVPNIICLELLFWLKMNEKNRHNKKSLAEIEIKVNMAIDNFEKSFRGSHYLSKNILMLMRPAFGMYDE